MHTEAIEIFRYSRLLLAYKCVWFEDAAKLNSTTKDATWQLLNAALSGWFGNARDRCPGGRKGGTGKGGADAAQNAAAQHQDEYD